MLAHKYVSAQYRIQNSEYMYVPQNKLTKNKAYEGLGQNRKSILPKTKSDFIVTIGAALITALILKLLPNTIFCF